VPLATEGCEIRREDAALEPVGTKGAGRGTHCRKPTNNEALEQGKNAGGRKQEEKSEREAQSLRSRQIVAK